MRVVEIRVGTPTGWDPTDDNDEYCTESLENLCMDGMLRSVINQLAEAHALNC
jgi:hypothetical protein